MTNIKSYKAVKNSDIPRSVYTDLSEADATAIQRASVLAKVTAPSMTFFGSICFPFRNFGIFVLFFVTALSRNL